MTQTAAIVGAGVLGRLLALKAHARGWRVTLFERGDASGSSACSVVPPAMLAPYCELDVSEPVIASMGAHAAAQWRSILDQFGMSVYFQQQGSLVVAHPHDRDELERFRRSVDARAGAQVYQVLNAAELAVLEPELDRRFQSGLFFPSEGQIDSRGVIAEALAALQKREVDCRFGCEVLSVAANEIRMAAETLRFDMVFDCRGYGAAADMPDLRAVRGEIVRVQAPDVNLKRPVRLLHPRWPLYAVPQPEHRYVIGATVVESEDRSPVSVRSMLELLSTAFTLNAGFSEARILETSVGLRPAYPNNEPRLMHKPGLIRLNGMYRHGYLLSPSMTEWACDLAERGAAQSDMPASFYEAA